MFVIYTIADVRCLREARAVPDALIDAVEASLRDMHEHTGGGLPLEEYSSEACGATVIMQPGDGPGAYDALGLHGGVLERRPEWAGRGNLGGKVTYQVIFMRGNDRAVSIFIPADAADAATEARLAEEVDGG